MSCDDFINDLKDILDDFPYAGLNEHLATINPASCTEVQSRQILNLLRKKRLFEELEQVTSRFFMLGETAPVVRRQWAQSVIEQDRVHQALTALESVREQVKDHPEGPEIRGLIGRAYKQRYVNERTPQDLVDAITAYKPDWDKDPEENRWHGINLAACLARAKADGVNPRIDDDYKVIAKQILTDIEALETPKWWDYATAMEASVALGDKKKALRWAKDYIIHSVGDAFALVSTTRQLKELWQVEGQDLGNLLLPVLEYELLQLTGDGAQLELGEKMPDNEEGFESVWGPQGVVYLEWMQTLFDRGRTIARIFDSATGKREGTGFLLAGSVLNPNWSGAPVLVTNSHVASNQEAHKPALMCPGHAKAEFTRLPNQPSQELGDILATSAPEDLDFSVFKIEPVDGAEPLNATPYKPAIPNAEETQRIYVVGHPGGRELAVSLYDNNLAEYENPYVRYRSPTEGGNSGSPVFNRQWDTFAVHHRARKEKRLNEGVLIEAIKAKLAT